MTRRNTELLLLCLAAPFVVLLFSMVLVNEGAELSLETLAVPVGLFGAFVVAHIGVRLLAKNADPAILPVVFALSGIGIAFVTRLAPDLAMRQVMWLFLGIALMVVTLALVRNLDKLARYKYTFMIVGIVLLLMPMLPGIGQEVLGSRIWIKIGSFSFQPGEIAKVCIVIFLASYLAQNREMLSVFTVRVGRFYLPDVATIGPLLIMWGISFSIAVFEKDLGSALVCFVLFLTMLYVASGKKMFLIVGFGLAALGCVILYAAFGHIQIRVNTWLDPFSDAMNTGYQLCQSIYSLADGGMLGVGVGNGLAENIPVVESDFIFAAIAEETGLLGGAGVLLLFLCLAVRGFATAARAKSDVSSFVAVGATVTIVLQAFIIVGGVTRLIPLTGLTLPFISQGGSSLLASFIGIGLLLRCGDEGTGINSEIKDGTMRMRAIGAHGTARGAGDTGVLGRVALGRRLTSTMMAFALLFAALVANLTYIMVFMADEYQSYPGNNHTLYKESRTERGSISTYDGVVLAESIEQEGGTYERTYPQGSLASHVVGYYSEQYGLSGIEQSMNDTLKGQENFASWSDVVNHLAGVNTPGNDVTLTLNSKIQRTAEEVLQGYKGAVVALDPETGAVLASASSPTYSNADVDTLLANAAAGTDSSNGALIDRATNALYAPGSTFKLVTLTALLENGLATENTQVEAPAFAEIGNAKVTNANDVGYGTITLKRATEVSSNTAFGALGADKVGAELLVETAMKFGFNKTVDDLELPLYTSLMPDPEEMTTWETAWAACGQPVGQHESPAGPQATVMQMAMVAAAIANDGVLETPHFVEGIYNAKGERSFTASPKSYGTVMSKQTADSITDMMLGVVENGTGADASIKGVEVAGKTGTAETNKEYNDSWFVGFAPADNPRVVVAVLIEEGVHGEDESGEASSRAKSVIQTALEVQGLL
ncbi:MAG: FtsW/RodA/SpoVE family cell cycle protein [Slackia sp.]|nr:FtsW/RodA/SpoVE family cell cycle protein [Slackia sp.]